MRMRLTTDHQNTWGKNWENCKKKHTNPRLQLETKHSSIRHGQIQQVESQLEHSWTQQPHQSTGRNGHRQTTPQQQQTHTFSSSRAPFTKADQILGHKMHLNKFKRMAIIHLLLDHNRIKLEISNKKIFGKPQNTWRYNTLPSNTFSKKTSQDKF